MSSAHNTAVASAGTNSFSTVLQQYVADEDNDDRSLLDAGVGLSQNGPSGQQTNLPCLYKKEGDAAFIVLAESCKTNSGHDSSTKQIGVSAQVQIDFILQLCFVSFHVIFSYKSNCDNI